ncbi:hypothetical protein [Labrys neptuniae]|uniref:Uncharacterized protein n=1 Tax=Labrys neptuniae TaxID=376174 RepID=A0ABV3PY25_9HYPH
MRRLLQAAIFNVAQLSWSDDIVRLKRLPIVESQTMGETKKKIYEALVAGATSGLHSAPLFAYVANKNPKSDNKRIIQAAFHALRDPHLTNPSVLKAICSLAAERRLIELGLEPTPTRPRHKKNSPQPC